MSIEFYEALKWSSAAFICGVFLREYAPDSLGKWLGRGGVLVSLCVMSAFGLHSARECVTLIQLVELENGREISVVPVVTGYEIKTKSGSIISWGGPGTMPTATGRIRGSFAPSGLSNRITPPASDGADAVPHAKHVTASAATQSKPNAANAYDEGGRNF